MKKLKKLNIVLLVLITAFLYSCTKDSEEVSEKTGVDSIGKNYGGITAGGLEFKVEYDKPRQIYSIENKDLDNDGDDEIIVLSVVKDEPGDQYMDYYNFDLMQVFALDSAGKNYVKISTDSIDYGESLTYEDMQRNFTYQMLIKTNTGGNDVYASKGMFVYDLKPANKLEMIKYIEFGNPEVMDLNGDGKTEIVVTDSYWGTMPSVDVIYYTKDIYRLENGQLVRKNAEYKEFYEEKIDAAKQKYDNEKKKMQNGERPGKYPLYGAVVTMFVNYMSEEQNAPILAFWNNEKDFLKKNLPEDQFVDLQNFVLRLTPSAINVQ